MQESAKDYAEFMVQSELSKKGEGGKKQALAYRMLMHGGAAKGCEEIVFKLSATQGRTNLPYRDIAKDFVFKIFNGKYETLIKDENYRFMGVAAMLDEAGKKAYFSCILGNYLSFNEGKDLVLSSGLALTTKTKLEGYDSKICKKIDRAKNIEDFQSSLSVDGNSIYIETDQYKTLGRVLKLPKDGLAADVVYSAQYKCGEQNIVDNSLPSKGFMTNPIYQPKIEKYNEYEGKEARYKLKMKLGDLPDGIDGDYELNLVLIQDNHVCKNISKSYIIKGDVEASVTGNILADTIIVYNTFNYHYKPEPDTAYLDFKIPFELGKAQYKPEDIKPFIETLNEPDFIVQKLKISAFSSIEGEEETNEKLREARAKSIVDAFMSMQKDSIRTEIVTSDSWEMFFTDIAGTKWDTLKNFTKDTIRTIVSNNKVTKELEPILAKHRFAKINMEVIYDISGKKEQAFVLKKFHKALDTGDVVEALAIQKYIMKNVRRGRYPNSIIEKLNIPKDSVRFAGMMMNWLWLNYVQQNKAIDKAFHKEVLRLLTLDAENDYILYNKVLCDIMLDSIEDEGEIYEIQRQIDDLLTSSLRKDNVDPLNLQFQIKILTSINRTFEPSNEKELVNEVVGRIKEIVDIQDDDTEGAMNLANLFIQMQDYQYATIILEPFLENESIPDEILYSYLSVCSKLPNKHLTKKFERAFYLASLKDKSTFCDLVSEQKFSVQILENPVIKKMHCEKCSN